MNLLPFQIGFLVIQITGCFPSFKQKRIVGGQMTKQHEFPWQASIVWRVGISKGAHICGGTLIHKDYVLTAAHCFVHGIKPEYYSIILGDHLKDKKHAHEEIKEIETIHISQKYNSSSQDSDITLIRLKTPATISQFIQTISLPKFFDFEIPGLLCTITGWGENGKNKKTNALHKANVNIINYGLCNDAQSYAGRLTGNMFCAGHKDGLTDTCQGDSGGPLQCLRQGKWVLNGVTSWGDGCGVKHKYGVYVTVRHYLPWIQFHLKNNETNPPLPPKPKVPLPPVKIPPPPPLPSNIPPLPPKIPPQPKTPPKIPPTPPKIPPPPPPQLK